MAALQRTSIQRACAGASQPGHGGGHGTEAASGGRDPVLAETKARGRGTPAGSGPSRARRRVTEATARTLGEPRAQDRVQGSPACAGRPGGQRAPVGAQSLAPRTRHAYRDRLSRRPAGRRVCPEWGTQLQWPVRKDGRGVPRGRVGAGAGGHQLGTQASSLSPRARLKAQNHHRSCSVCLNVLMTNVVKGRPRRVCPAVAHLCEPPARGPCP